MSISPLQKTHLGTLWTDFSDAVIAEHNFGAPALELLTFRVCNTFIELPL